MDRVNGYVQVWHTSSCSAEDTNGVIGGHVTTSSDFTFTLDFPIPREFYVNTPSASQTSSMRKRDTSKVYDNCCQSIHKDLSRRSAQSQVNHRTASFTSWTSAKIAEACEEYSDVSTFHGMRFICGKNFHRIRRLIWMLLILGCLCALALQVYNQVVYFNSNPKTVFVEQRHKGFVEFPSLTICNENAYKITAAVDADMYEMVNKMASESLTMAFLKEKGRSNMKLDEMINLLGNHKETMILRCKWGEDECSLDNFTTVLTDHGLCFTFNGPDSNRDLRVHNPGLSKGLQLTLNVEEYERMAGPHVASGIHILVHMRREYPLVEQFGQAVAAGSHTFVALRLKQERRLGYPYDSCKPGTLDFVSNITYNYDLPACQTDCFVKYLIDRCGCKDYYMPGDVTVCTLVQYITCLHPAQKDYPVKAEQNCQCSMPCETELVETTYSYAELSKSAIDKIDEEDINRILPRYKKALDVYEYVSQRNQHKKQDYQAFSGSLSSISKLYATSISALKEVTMEVLRLQEVMAAWYQVKNDYIRTQTYVVKKGFVDVTKEIDEETLGELADDLYMFSYITENKILDLASASDKHIRDVQYKLLREQLLGRMWLADLSEKNLTRLVKAYTDGNPMRNYSWPAEQQLASLFGLDEVIPRQLLEKAINQSEDGANIGMSTHSHICQISLLLWRLLNISQVVYESENMTLEQRSDVRETIEEFQKVCQLYLRARENLYSAVIEWPLAELGKATASIKATKSKCETYFNDLLTKLDKLIAITTNTANSSLSAFTNLDTLITDYLATWNVTKFDMAEEFLSNVSLLALSNLETAGHSIQTYAEHIDNMWPQIDTCMTEMIQEIHADQSLNRVCKTREEFAFLGDRQTMNVSNKLRAKLTPLRVLNEMHRVFHTKTEVIGYDLQTFNARAVIDSHFYSKNFIFLDVFFTDITYTVTEHQAAYDVFKLLSDIGGSMGLLVGASAISLFEFVDLFCVIATYICRGSRRMGEVSNKTQP